MVILGIIAEFVFEVIFIDFFGGTATKLKNAVLELRGIDPISSEEVKFKMLKRRYEYKTITIKSAFKEFEKGRKGVVLELIDGDNASVEFQNSSEVIQIPIKHLRVK